MSCGNAGFFLAPLANVARMAHRSRTLTVRGDTLRALRERKVGTLADLAARLGVKDHGHLSKIETGKVQPSITTLHRLAKALDVELDAFTESTAA